MKSNYNISTLQLVGPAPVIGTTAVNGSKGIANINAARVHAAIAYLLVRKGSQVKALLTKHGVNVPANISVMQLKTLLLQNLSSNGQFRQDFAVMVQGIVKSAPKKSQYSNFWDELVMEVIGGINQDTTGTDSAVTVELIKAQNEKVKQENQQVIVGAVLFIAVLATGAIIYIKSK